jgi:hypothetical protein
MPPIFATFAAGSSKNFGASGFNRKRGSAAAAAANPTPLISYFAVAGGGAGAFGGSPQGGGGGAGGALLGSNVPVVTTAGVLYIITVGAGGGPGGTAPNRSENGGNGGNTGMYRADTGATLFSWAVGGGGGGGGSPGNNGSSGGSGGGGVARGNSAGGSGTPGQGNTGGEGAPGPGGCGGGGGGGAGSVGKKGLDGNTPGNGGAGGIGITSAISGSTLGYAGGGAGGGDFGQAPTCIGGAHPASDGNTPYGGGPGSGTAATAGRGGGGNGKNAGGGPGGTNGGDGSVIISYDDSFDDLVLASGATRTVSGGKKIYTFTGSGSAAFGSLYSGANDANGLYGRRYSGNMGTNVNFFGSASPEGTPQAFTTIDFNNDLPGGGGGGVNNFSFQWLGYFKPDVAGTWNFRLDTDDTGYLWIGTASNSYRAFGGFTNSNGIINNGSASNQTGSIEIPTANLYYPVRLQFGEGGGDDKIRFYFTPPAGSSYGTSEIQLLTGLFYYNSTSNGF